MSGVKSEPKPEEIEDKISGVASDKPSVACCFSMEAAMLKPKGYNGEDPDTYLRGFIRLARANKWDEERQLAILPALFSETHEWLARELEDDVSLKTMEDAKKKILARLMPTEKRRAFLHEFYEARMTVADEPRVFVSKLQTLVRAAMPELGLDAQEQLVSEQLTRSVPSQWRLRLLDCEVTTTEGLIRRLERIQTTEQLQKEMGASSLPVRTVNQRRTGRMAQDSRTCFKCGKRGHIAVNCRQAPSATNVTPDLVCFQCGGRGHVRRQCPSVHQWSGQPQTQDASRRQALQTGGQQDRQAGSRPGPASRPASSREVRRSL